MKICLIRCPSPFLIDDKVFPPLGLMAIGTFLKQRGHDVLIADTEDLPTGYDYYGLGPSTPEYPLALEVRNIIKSEIGAKVIIGGPHVNATKGEVEGWDHVFTGFLGKYPIIDRTLVDIKSYKYFINGELATTLMTSQGCPYSCAFCSQVHKFSLRDSEDVINEIKYLHGLGYRALMFFDDIFILKRKRAEKIFRYMKELGIISRCFVRADTIVKHGQHFVKMMAECGCVEVGMGIESGSDTILNNINKGESSDTIKTAIKMLKNERIRVKGFFIIGLPGENFGTIAETESFLLNTKLDDVDFTIFRPYPGSAIWENRNYYDVSWDDSPLSELFYKGKPGEYHGCIETLGLKSNEIVEIRDKMEATYKCQPCQ